MPPKKQCITAGLRQRQAGDALKNSSGILNFYDIIPEKYKDETENPNFNIHNIKTPFYQYSHASHVPANDEQMWMSSSRQLDQR